MDFININESVQSAIRISKGLAREYGNGSYTPAHLLHSLMHKDIGIVSFVDALDKDSEYLKEWAEVRIEELPKESALGDIMPDKKMKSLFEEADNVRLKWGLLEICPLCVLAALSRPEAGFTVDELKSFPIREKEVEALILGDSLSQVDMKNHDGQKGGTSADPVWAAKKGNLAKYCTNKSELAKSGKVYPIVCRDKETRQMMEILGRLAKPNVLIIGDAGVGKTAMVDGLAYSISKGMVPEYLSDVDIFELDTGTLIAGATYKGEIEERLKGIIKELESHSGAILFIDEIHTLIDPKSGNSGAASILKPELSKGNITVIGATTIDEYRKLIEPDHAFNRRFEVLQVGEPNVTDTVNMIESVLERYESYHGVGVSIESLPECVALAKRYVKERRLPDAAIDIIDRTLSAVKMINQSCKKDVDDFTQHLADIEAQEELLDSERAEKCRLLHFTMLNRLSPIVQGMLSATLNSEANYTNFNEWREYILALIDLLKEIAKDKITTIDMRQVAAIISASTGIPIGKIESGEKEKLLGMVNLLQRRVVGQDNALRVLADAIVESRSGMNKPGQPIGSFFLLGPTGTGKTELAKALAEALFNDEKAMIRFDMSEFKEEHSAALLYGAPPGYVGYEEGGLLVNKIRKQPYAVVLFDEIEKAHSSVYDIFLQVMDEGKIHDRLGKEGDFSNAIVLFTSNVGSEWLQKQKEEGKTPSTTDIMDVMSSHFRPEFLARLSEIVPFSPINEQMLKKIFDIQLKSVILLLDKQNISLEITEEAKEVLATRGFVPKYGARQILGTLRNYVRRPISKMIISGEVVSGNTVLISVNESNEVIWSVK